MRIPTIVLWLVVVVESVGGLSDRAADFNADEGAKDRPRSQSGDQRFESIRLFQLLVPSKDEHEGLRRAVVDDSDFVVAPDAARVLHKSDVVALFFLIRSELTVLCSVTVDEVDRAPLPVGLRLQSLHARP